MESRKRSIKKAITWAIIDNIATMSVAYAFTHSIGVSIGISLISNTIEILLYFGHERIWGRKQSI